MMSHLMIVGAAFVISFVLTSFLYSFLIRFEVYRRINFTAIASVVLGSVIVSAISLMFGWDKFDFVSNIGFWSFLAPLIGLGIIFATCFVNRVHAVETGVLVASIIGVFGGDLFIDLIPTAPVYVNKICSVLIWFLFSLGIRTVAVLTPVLQVQGITISCGFVLLFIFGASPFMIGVFSAALLASMCVAYLNCSNKPFEAEFSPIIGYIIGWLGLISNNEMLLPCYIILVMFCFVEMGISLIRKLTFLNKYKNFRENSFVVQIYKSGIAPMMIIKSLWMLSGIVVIFAVFQANGVNNYSIPIFIGIVTLWHIYKLVNWREEEKNWKEVNKETVSEIKETIGTVVKEIKKTKASKINNDVKTSKTSKAKRTSTSKGNSKVKSSSKAKKGKK